MQGTRSGLARTFDCERKCLTFSLSYTWVYTVWVLKIKLDPKIEIQGFMDSSLSARPTTQRGQGGLGVFFFSV